MDSQQTTIPQQKTGATDKGRQGTCQVCGKTASVIFDPEKAPPNRLCFRCASKYGMQESDER